MSASVDGRVGRFRGESKGVCVCVCVIKYLHKQQHNDKETDLRPRHAEQIPPT